MSNSFRYCALEPHDVSEFRPLLIAPRFFGTLLTFCSAPEGLANGWRSGHDDRAHEPVASCDAAHPERQTSLCTTRAPVVVLARAPALDALLQVELPRSDDLCFREQLWTRLPTLAQTLVRSCP